MVLPTYQLLCDWNNDLDYADSYEDITAYVRSVACKRGRDFPTTLPGQGYVAAGTLDVELLNTAGRFSPNNSSGPLYGNIKPGRRVRLRNAGYDALVRADGATTLWRFGETSGLFACELSSVAGGTGVNVTQGVSGALTNDTNKAIDLNGSTAYGTWSDEAGLDLGDVFTLEGWFYRDTGGADQFLLDKGTNAYRWKITSGNVMQLHKANVSVIVSSTSTVATGAWTHLAVTKNGSTVALYINGVDVTGTVTNATLADNSTGLVLGANSGVSSFYDGKVDEIALYKNVALTGAQVLAHYQAQARFATLNLWTGVLDRIEPAAPQVGVLPTAKLTAFGHLSRLVEKNVSPAAIAAGQYTGTIMTALLDEAGIDSSEYSIETGVGTCSRWYVGNRPALDAARELESTELGLLFEAADGKLTFHSRHHRLLTAASTTSQATFTDAAAAALGYHGIEQLDTNRAVVNEALATVPQFTVGALAVLWTLTETNPEIGPGQDRTWIAEYPNPGNSQGAYVDAWTTTSLSTDVTATGVTAATDLAVATLFASTTAVKHKTPNWMRIKIANNHASNTAVLTLLQARGTPVTIGDGITVLGESSSSKSLYGRRTYQFPGPWLPSTTVAQSYVDFIATTYGAPITGLRLTFRVNDSAAQAVQGLTREIGDRVTITATGVTLLGLSGDYWIEAIEHRIDGPGGTRHWVSWLLSAVSAAGVAGSSPWVLGTSVLGTSTILAF